MSTETRSQEIEFAQAIDTEYVEQYTALVMATHDVQRAERKLREGVGQYYDWRTKEWDGSLEDALQVAPTGWRLRYWPEQVDAYYAATAVTDAIVARMSVLRKVYAEHKWSRFYLVIASNGHVHSDTSCHTCYDTTSFAWLPHLSGLTEAEAVEDQGEILCSVCFPSAPVAWTTGTSKADDRAKAERAAAKAERLEKKRAKALVPEDIEGGLEVPYLTWGFSRDGKERTKHRTCERLTTITAAKRWLTDSQEGYAWRQGEEDEYSPENVALVAQVYAARIGSTPEAEIAAAKKRAAKRQ